MGIYSGFSQPDSLFERGVGGKIVRKANIFPNKPTLANVDWDKIVAYYTSEAPDTIALPKREQPIKIGLPHFQYREAKVAHRPSLTTMVKILPDNMGIVFSDGKRNNNKLTFLHANLSKNYSVNMSTTPVHYYQRNDTLLLTTAGKSIFPHDAPDGSLQQVLPVNNQYTAAKILIPNLQRPVHMAYGDLNQDGLEDVVACEFGGHTGKLAWYQNNGSQNYSQHILRDMSGAISAHIRDMNADGLPDIIALMAQGQEGVFLYENKGNGEFVEQKLLTFSPLHGSQYIELVDFNQDGFEDILYTCGDNADKTPYLKAYHGVYLYTNNGNNTFTQSYFYHLNGAYKATAHDFDLDGDLDIAAISFFPDYSSYPEESFVYLENTGNLSFRDYSFAEATNGRWIVMDANDMDGDGDVDLALGSFVYFVAKGDTTRLGEKWFANGPSVVVLENTTN